MSLDKEPSGSQVTQGAVLVATRANCLRLWGTLLAGAGVLAHAYNARAPVEHTQLAWRTPKLSQMTNLGGDRTCRWYIWETLFSVQHVGSPSGLGAGGRGRADVILDPRVTSKARLRWQLLCSRAC